MLILKKYLKLSFFLKKCILTNGFKKYVQELGDWLVPPKKGVYIWNDSYPNTRFVCTDAVLCMSASSDQPSVFEKLALQAEHLLNLSYFCYAVLHSRNSFYRPVYIE